MPAVAADRSQSTDLSLETAVANIAYAKLSDRAPKLFDHALGFQLVDQSEDRTRAVGLFAFQIGGRKYRVPVFYRDGSVYGTEILMPDANTFRPLTDSWVAYLTSGKPTAVGEERPAGASRSAGPNLWQLSTPPTKWASAEPDWATSLARTKVGRFLRQSDSDDPLLDAVRGSAKTAAAFARLRHELPWYDAAVRRFYGDAADAAQAAGRQTAKTAAATPLVPQTGTGMRPRLVVVRVTRIQSVSVPPPLTPDERVRFANGRNIYRDDRADREVSQATALPPARPASRTLTNPGHGTGHAVADVRMPGGGTERCAVFSAPLTPDDANDDAALVVRLSDGAYALCPRTRVWLAGAAGEAAYFDWWKSLPTAGAASDLPDRDFALVDPYARATCPLSRSYANKSGGQVVAVYVCGPAVRRTDGTGWQPPTRFESDRGNPPWDPTGLRQPDLNKAEDDPTRYTTARPKILFTAQPTQDLALRRGCFLAPPGTRLLALEHAAGFDPAWPIAPGPLWSKEAFAHLPPAGAGPLLEIERVDRDLRVVDPRKPGVVGRVKLAVDVEADLVERHGLRPAVAERLVDLALEHGRAKATVKYAAGYLRDLVDEAPDAPGWPHLMRESSGVGPNTGDLTVMRPANGVVSVDDLNPSTGPEGLYPDPHEDPALKIGMPGWGSGPLQDQSGSLGAARRAADAGKKDVFGASSLFTLLQYTGVDTQTTRLLNRTLPAVNELGRSLCHIYWNRDAYAERYGIKEVSTLIDRVRAQFEKLGDLYLVFQEKPIDTGVVGLLPARQEEEEGSE